MRWTASVMMVAALVAACADEPADDSVDAERSTSTLPDTSVGTTIADESTSAELELAPLRNDFDELPELGVEDGGCSFVSPADIIEAPLVFVGSLAGFGELGEVPASDLVLVGRTVDFTIRELIIDEADLVGGADVIRLLNIEHVIESGARTDRYFFHTDLAGSGDGTWDDVLVAAFAPWPDDRQLISSLGFAVGESPDGNADLNGDCRYLAPLVDSLAARFGESSGQALLERFARARADGADIAELRLAEAEYYQELDG